MRPETVKEFRERLAGKARQHLAECLISNGLNVSAKNGPMNVTPDIESITQSAQNKKDWEETAGYHGFQVNGGLVPTRLVAQIYKATSLYFPNVHSLSSFLGGPWPAKAEEICALATDIPDILTPEVLRALFGVEVQDLRILRSLCSWRSTKSPDEIAETMLREISVKDMNTKWIERNAGVVLMVFGRAGWLTQDTGSLAERLGISDRDRSDVRVRLHPQDAELYKLWTQFSVPSTIFMTFPFKPDSVLILENKTTFLRVTPKPGQVVIWGNGMAIIAWAQRMKWLHEVPDLVYWGDCDGAGYLILDRLRTVLSEVRSINMTLREIIPNLDKGVVETEAEAVKAEMPLLSEAEAKARVYMDRHSLRLEQEFIEAWDINISLT